MSEYIDFLCSKIQQAPESGFTIDPSEVHPALKPHQRDGVVWSIRKGRAADFWAFGLGKTLLQYEMSDEEKALRDGTHELYQE